MIGCESEDEDGNGQSCIIYQIDKKCRRDVKMMLGVRWLIFQLFINYTQCRPNYFLISLGLNVI